MKKALLVVAFCVALAGSIQPARAQDHDSYFPGFKPNTLVLTRSVYVGTPDLLVPGVTVLPPGCVTNTDLVVPGGSGNPYSIICVTPTNDGSFPGVFNNAAVDGQFGITSPIFLDNLTTSGDKISTLPIPSNQIVTSFSSKSELALHLSTDGKSVTFVGYRAGPGFVTAPNIFDVSNGNTPGLIDPTNAAGNYYRTVGEVDARGHLMLTESNAYSGDNGRGAFKGGNGLYYLVGNDNSGNLTNKDLKNIVVGQDLVNDTGAELVIPGQAPPIPPNNLKIGDFEINQINDPLTGMPYALDKPGKDNNYRGITIFDNTLYITKGSGGNGVNTVYQVGSQGVLPTGDPATLATVPIKILPGFPATLASGTDPGNGRPTPVSYPFGIWFANSKTLYVCDEGDGNLITPAVNGNVASTDAQMHAGLQKWILADGVWRLAYIVNAGLNIGVPYGVKDYPTVLNPATGGCRNLTGNVSEDGLVTVYAVTSTISPSGDQGADPNLLVKVTDRLNATSLPGGKDDEGGPDHFQTIRKAKAGEVYRGVTWAPRDRDE